MAWLESGEAWLEWGEPWLGQARYGMPWLGTVWRGQLRNGRVSLGEVSLGLVRRGKVRYGNSTIYSTWLGVDSPGKPRHGAVRSGLGGLRFGVARHA